MQERPRIFISHSSADNALTEQVAQALRTPADGGTGYELLVDLDVLQPGTPWPRQLHEMMARCEAAIVLLTPFAVQSAWVLKETTILTWRLSLEPSFRLFPVRFPQVTRAELEAKGFAPLFLTRVQEVPDTDPAAIARFVRGVVGEPVRGNTPMDRLTGRLIDLFREVGDHTLREIAERLRVERPAWNPNRDLRQQYVDEIASRIVREDLGGFGGIHELIDTLSYSPRLDPIKQIFRILSPYWVDAEAAGRLPALLEAEPRRAAAINGAYVGTFTADMYVRKAFPLSSRYDVWPIAGGTPGRILDHVTEEICSHVRQREPSAGTNEAIVDRLARRSRTVFVVVPPPHPDRQELTAIQDRFPRLTFLLWTGDELDLDEDLPVESLIPPVDLDREAREEEHCREARSILDRIR
jgi:hypothetical protein